MKTTRDAKPGGRPLWQLLCTGLSLIGFLILT